MVLDMQKTTHKDEIKVSPRFKLTFDASICRWCRSCELICSLSHEGSCSPYLSRISIDVDQFNAEVSASFCMQCPKPLCLASCPVEEAMIINSVGALTINQEACIGCGECAKACPFNKEGKVLKLHRSKNVYFKCDLCDGDPVCIQICPTGALKIVEVER